MRLEVLIAATSLSLSVEMAGANAAVADYARDTCPEAYAAVHKAFGEYRAAYPSPQSVPANIWDLIETGELSSRKETGPEQLPLVARMSASYGLINAATFSLVGTRVPSMDAKRATLHARMLAANVQLFDCLELTDEELRAVAAEDVRAELGEPKGAFRCIVEAARLVHQGIEGIDAPERVRDVLADVQAASYTPCRETEG